MNEEQIIGNRLIAEFSGDKIESRPVGSHMPNQNAYYHICDGKVIYLSADKGNSEQLNELWEQQAAKMKFHTSYDWLMPVVEKIENTGQTIVEIGKSFCKITPILYDTKSDSMKRHAEIYVHPQSTTKLESTYSAVIQFITWLNDKK